METAFLPEEQHELSVCTNRTQGYTHRGGSLGLGLGWQWVGIISLDWGMFTDKGTLSWGLGFNVWQGHFETVLTYFRDISMKLGHNGGLQ